VATCSETDTAKLVERVAFGDHEAFGEIYSIYLDRIYRYILYQVGERMTAEDLTQEVFLKAWRAIGSYKGQGREFSTWLYRIAHNHVIDSLRARRPSLSLEAEEDEGLQISTDSGDPQQELERSRARKEVLELVSCLPVQQRQMIALRFSDGLDNGEIERITGKSQGAIRVMQMRALATLQKRLVEEGRQ